MELLQIATAFLLTSSTRFNTSYERYIQSAMIITNCDSTLRSKYPTWSPYPGGDSHMKGAGMFVVLLRGVNFGFWSH